MADDKQFFDDESPLGGRPRHDSIQDAIRWADEALGDLGRAVDDRDLEEARKAFKEIKGWVDALDDDLCERNEDGTRKD